MGFMFLGHHAAEPACLPPPHLPIQRPRNGARRGPAALPASRPKSARPAHPPRPPTAPHSRGDTSHALLPTLPVRPFGLLAIATAGRGGVLRIPKESEKQKQKAVKGGSHFKTSASFPTRSPTPHSCLRSTNLSVARPAAPAFSTLPGGEPPPLPPLLRRLREHRRARPSRESRRPVSRSERSPP